MTKRSTEKEIDELLEEKLSNLSPDEWLELALSATAEGKEEQLNQLLGTYPGEAYTQPDKQHWNRGWCACQLAQRAAHDLLTSLERAAQSQRDADLRLRIWACTDVDLAEVGLGEVKEGRSVDERRRELSARYTGYERFAEEELNVALETWLSLVEMGPEVASATAWALETDEKRRPPIAEDVSVGTSAEEVYQELKDRWDRATGGG